jgi:hypothetical protein
MMGGGSDVSFFVRIEKNHAKKEQKKVKRNKMIGDIFGTFIVALAIGCNNWYCLKSNTSWLDTL